MSRVSSHAGPESGYKRLPRPEDDAAVTPNAAASSTSTAVPSRRTLTRAP
jgi:hypothetical protein